MNGSSVGARQDASPGATDELGPFFGLRRANLSRFSCTRSRLIKASEGMVEPGQQ